MTDRYRELDAPLDLRLFNVENAAVWAHHEAVMAYPIGARCIIRTKVYGKRATEREAEIIGVGISLNMSLSKPIASVHVNTRNLTTGKTKVYYPSIEVDGIPQIRLKKESEDGE